MYDNYNNRVYYNSQDKLEEIFLGNSVRVEGEDLILSNGTRWHVEPDDGACGGCYGGFFELQELNGCETIITSVKVVEDEELSEGNSHRGDYDCPARIRLFGVWDGGEVALVNSEGDWGNGFYGGGFFLTLAV